MSLWYAVDDGTAPIIIIIIIHEFEVFPEVKPRVETVVAGWLQLVQSVSSCHGGSPSTRLLKCSRTVQSTHSTNHVYVCRGRHIACHWHNRFGDIPTDLDLEHDIHRISKVCICHQVVCSIPEALVPLIGHVTVQIEGNVSTLKQSLHAQNYVDFMLATSHAVFNSGEPCRFSWSQWKRNCYSLLMTWMWSWLSTARTKLN